MLSVTLPDGTRREYSNSVTPYDVAAEIGPGLAKAAIAAEVDGAQIDLTTPLPAEGSVNLRLLTKRDPESLDILRHSCAHVMAQAVMRLHEGVQLAFGPCTSNGFYYDMLLKEPLSEEDFPAIEAEMAKIVKENLGFERMDVPRSKALSLCQELGQEFKVEHIDTGLSDEETLSFYRQGEFLDLCRGRHIPSTGHIGKAFKLTSLAGAYWKGDAARPQLQRLYATAFFDKQQLDDYLRLLEEAKRRDHRVLGKQLELFTISPLVGSGLVLWLPKGAIIRQTLEDYLKSELRQRGYDAVYTPNIGKVDLYEISGHFPYYSDSQFRPIEMEDGERYLLKPMNCPHHIMIYKSKPRSYRDLPVRLAEFGTVYRYEQSGELSGMTRVRGFTQDDAHIFCTEDQVAGEIRGCLEMTLKVLKSLGMDKYRVRLGFRDPESDKYVGNIEVWDRAEAAIQQVAEEMDLPGREPEPGEAAFYGPKIDFVVTDCIGREWQLGTVQLDYNLPSEERFGLEYIGADNQPHRPVMIHRAPLGSMERFVGVLIEHFAGAFPLWLAPEQARVLTVSEKSEEYGREIEAQLRAAGFRVTGDYRGQKLGAKIREAQLELIPYMLVVGEKDAQNDTVTLRDRIEGDLGALPVAEALAKLQQEVADKTVRQVADTGGAALVDRSKKNEY
ncbi:threonine--tRNA ligase [Bythopirellula polymerisocia]|uniref:Threonine--tRNA ligase n=1 Tax=Bythopirellula polymerisocia TaxID=2528003 RepID=A0A5C6CZX3_9BACT|nr:threonine--tRNA ligase [Bythopirellula polymerisocia]TWU28219.1 Threonine--tRNA ligase [Bythopirellula polymerisocia]